MLLDEEGNAYLSDFGIAEDLTDWREVIPPGSLGYSSPEQLRGEAVDAQIRHLRPGDGRPGAPQRPRPRSRVADVVTEPPRTTRDRYREAGDLAVALRSAFGFSVQRPEDREGRTQSLQGPAGLHRADVDDFFGRDVLVDRLIARLAEPVEGSTFLTVVGPSGSGKSSVVRAGLVPALRAGALPGSESWFYAEMLPGAHPMEELEAALLRIAVDPPAPVGAAGAGRGGARPDRRSPLARSGTELVLVVDQFEEVFTMVEEERPGITSSEPGRRRGNRGLDSGSSPFVRTSTTGRSRIRGWRS